MLAPNIDCLVWPPYQSDTAPVAQRTRLPGAAATCVEPFTPDGLLHGKHASQYPTDDTHLYGHESPPAAVMQNLLAGPDPFHQVKCPCFQLFITDQLLAHESYVG